jgi:hypothetical protein
MSTRKSLALAALLALALGSAAAIAADAPGLGKPISPADIKAWDIFILPDGTNLPPGSGTAAQGAKLFIEKGCHGCHGEGGKGGTANMVVGSPSIVEAGITANKTIANFWGQTSTLFEYIRRAMPWPTPRTLTDEEVYSLCAYILAANKLIGENEVMDAKSLPQVKMPNRDNFIIKFPDKI